MPAVSALLGPIFNDFPILAKARIVCGALGMRLIEPGNPHQVAQIVGVESTFRLSGKSYRRVVFAMQAFNAHSTAYPVR